MPRKECGIVHRKISFKYNYQLYFDIFFHIDYFLYSLPRFYKIAGQNHLHFAYLPITHKILQLL